jgi:hypothetical protein
MAIAINSLSAGAAYQSPVPIVSPAAAQALSSTAASLSAESAVVASLGGGSSGVSVYTPTGLFDTLQQAGSVEEPISVPADGSDVDTSGTAQQAQDEGIVSSLPSAPSASGVYTGTGAVTGQLSEQAAANWADLLKTDPGLAGTVIADSYNAGLVSSLRVTA